MKMPLRFYMSENVTDVERSKTDEDESCSCTKICLCGPESLLCNREGGKPVTENLGLTRTACFSKADQWQQKKKCGKKGWGANWALHRFWCTQEQKKTTNTLSSNGARHKAPSVKPRQAKIKSTEQKHQTTGTATQRRVFSTPKKRTYGTTNFVTHFFFFHGFRHLQETLSSTIGIGHTHPQKRNSREKEKRKNLHRERKESLVVNTQRFPQYIFFLTSEITVSFSSSVSQRRRE